MSEIKVGGRVRHELMGEGLVRMDRWPRQFEVGFDNGIHVWCDSSSLTLIPDTVMVELTREDAEYWAAATALNQPSLRTTNLIEACKVALETTKEQA